MAVTIISTRYRDISFEEASKCVPAEFRAITSPAGWELYRGKSIEIVTPALPAEGFNRRFHCCEGPFYCVISVDGVRYESPTEYSVRPHIAEIGD